MRSENYFLQGVCLHHLLTSRTVNLDERPFTILANEFLFVFILEHSATRTGNNSFSCSLFELGSRFTTDSGSFPGVRVDSHIDSNISNMLVNNGSLGIT